MSSELLTESG